MNPTVLRVMFWKELRELAPFWIILAAVGFGIQALWLWNVWPEGPVNHPSMLELLQTALVFAGLFLLGCGGAQFAAERETGTYAFLRELPTGPGPVFFVKAATALVGSLVMALLLVGWVVAVAVFDGRFTLEKPFPSLLFFGLTGLEVFFWIIPFSLAGRRPFAAIVLGGLCGVLPAWFFSAATTLSPGPVLAIRGGLLAAIVLFDIWYATRWFREKKEHGNRAGGEGFHAAVVLPVMWTSRPTRRALFARLVWQQMREGAWKWLYAGVVIVAAGFVLVCTMRSGKEPAIGQMILYLAALLLPPRLGAAVFRTDQVDQRFRFLAEHGLSPRILWVTRQITGLVSAIPYALVIAALATFVYWEEIPKIFQYALPIEILLGFATAIVFGYAAGQFCSMMIRNPLVATFSGVALAVFGYIVASLLLNFHVNGYLLGAVWTVALFVATYLETDAWMTERRTWRTGMRTGLVLSVPLAAVLAGTGFYRAYEFPLVPPIADATFMIAADITPEEKANGAKVAALLGQLRVPDGCDLPPEGGLNEWNPRFLEENRTRLDELVDGLLAIDGPAAEVLYSQIPVAEPETVNAKFYKLSALGPGLSVEADRLAKEGRYDRATDYFRAKAVLGRYASRSSRGVLAIGLSRDDWRSVRRIAFASDWTPERVLEIRDELDASAADTASAAAEVRKEFLMTRLENRTSVNHDEPLGTIGRALPWERQRASRGLRILGEEVLQQAEAFDKAVRSGGPLPRFHNAEEWMTRAEEYLAFFAGPDFPYRTSTTYMKRKVYPRELERRATRVALTLLAWKRKHGAFPKRLEELVEGGMLDRIPTVLIPGEGEFRYDAEGLSKPVDVTMVWIEPNPARAFETFSWRIPKKTPLLWVEQLTESRAAPEQAWSVTMLPADKEAYPEPERPESPAGMEGGMGMGGPGMDGGMGMGGGMGAPGPVAGMPRARRVADPFLTKLTALQAVISGKRALLVPLGPVEFEAETLSNKSKSATKLESESEPKSESKSEPEGENEQKEKDQ